MFVSPPLSKGSAPCTGPSCILPHAGSLHRAPCSQFFVFLPLRCSHSWLRRTWAMGPPLSRRTPVSLPRQANSTPPPSSLLPRHALFACDDVGPAAPEELDLLIRYLSREGGKFEGAKFVILGHSTGCQDAVFHCRKCAPLPSSPPSSRGRRGSHVCRVTGKTHVSWRHICTAPQSKSDHHSHHRTSPRIGQVQRLLHIIQGGCSDLGVLVCRGSTGGRKPGRCVGSSFKPRCLTGSMRPQRRIPQKRCAPPRRW